MIKLDHASGFHTPGTIYEPQRVPTDAEIMDKVRKWNVRYDGGNDPLEFLERVEELAECYEIPLDRILRTMPELLRNKALAWHRNNRQNMQNWSEFTKEFRTFFLPARYEMKLMDKIRTRLQDKQETAKDYITAIQSLMRWQEKLSQSDKLERIYDNLRTEYRMYIKRKDFTTLGELFILTEEFEMLQSETNNQNHSNVRNQTHSNVRTQQPIYRSRNTNPNEQHRLQPIKPGYSHRDCCWRCGERGHTRFQCNQRRKLFCTECGKPNIRTLDCNCKSGNEVRVPGRQEYQATPTPQQTPITP